MVRALIGGLVAAAVLGVAAPANATPTQKCGGQGALRQAVTSPSVCYNEQTINGVTMRVDVVVNPDRTYALTFSLLTGPINQIIGFQANAHPHLSSDPGTSTSVGTLPAGEISFPLGGQFPAGNLCDGHQFDIKWWIGHPGAAGHWSPTLRISGATFVFATAATGCGVTPTTTVTTTVPTTVATTIPGQTTVPTTVAVATTPPARVAGCTLNASGVYVNDVTGQPCSTPSTGSNDWLAELGIALMALSLGGIVIIGLKIYREIAAH